MNHKNYSPPTLARVLEANDFFPEGAGGDFIERIDPETTAGRALLDLLSTLAEFEFNLRKQQRIQRGAADPHFSI